MNKGFTNETAVILLRIPQQIVKYRDYYLFLQRDRLNSTLENKRKDFVIKQIDRRFIEMH